MRSNIEICECFSEDQFVLHFREISLLKTARNITSEVEFHAKLFDWEKRREFNEIIGGHEADYPKNKQKQIR